MNNSDIYAIDDLKKSIKIKIDETLIETDELTDEEQINYLIMLYKSFGFLQQKVQKDIYELTK